MTDSTSEQVKMIKALPGVGYLSSAMIYLTMGILAGLVAIGLRGQTPDLRETLRALRDQPFGTAALLLVAAGSLCLLVWRLLQAFADLESKGRSAFGLVQRARYLISGLFYACMPILVWRMLTGAPTPSGEQWAREFASRLMFFPFGWTILVATGIGFLAYGGTCAYRMCRGNFVSWFHCEEMTAQQRSILFALGRLGYAARGFIFIVIGYFVVLAGWSLNPAQIAGQAGALYRVFHQPFGPLLLGLVSVGLISFGLFSLGALRFGRLPVKRMHQLVKSMGAGAAGPFRSFQQRGRGLVAQPDKPGITGPGEDRGQLACKAIGPNRG